MKKTYQAPQCQSFAFVAEGSILAESLTGQHINCDDTNTATQDEALSNKRELWDTDSWLKN